MTNNDLEVFTDANIESRRHYSCNTNSIYPQKVIVYTCESSRMDWQPTVTLEFCAYLLTTVILKSN